ncbi:MAG TPA: PsbP-related protein [Methanobacterium sp.]|jgi:hypothetical protein|nr:MAG: zinc ribbon domain-containing protein [Methanobacterium sp.]HOI71074.1 PsbP-related protein [Methanobacterium sp.]
MKCSKCGHDNDYDATFCEKCGINLKAPGMSTLTRGLVVVAIILIAAIGMVAATMMTSQQPTTTSPTNSKSLDDKPTSEVSQTPTQETESGSAYKTYSNGIISFQYPSSWDVLSNGANSMAVVGSSDYPKFSVYDESKYGHTSLADYVESSKIGMEEDGYTVNSERSTTVDGLPAYEIIYQGKTIILHMVLVEKSPGQKYYALEGSDYIDNYGQSESIFNQIINSFKFL